MSGKSEQWIPVTAAERKALDKRLADNEMIPGGVRMQVDGTGIHFEKLASAEIPNQQPANGEPPATA